MSDPVKEEYVPDSSDPEIDLYVPRNEGYTVSKHIRNTTNFKIVSRNSLNTNSTIDFEINNSQAFLYNLEDFKVYLVFTFATLDASTFNLTTLNADAKFSDANSG